jgi:hypothetical protein
MGGAGGMSRKKYQHYVVFGALDKPDKGLLTAKVTSGPGKYALVITQLGRGKDRDYGGAFDIEDIEGTYTTLYFCKRESVDAMIKALEKLRDEWEKEEADDEKGQPGT